MSLPLHYPSGRGSAAIIFSMLLNSLRLSCPSASPRLLLFVDTGLAGRGFTGPQSTLKEAGINLLEGLAGTGIGGGGPVKVIPFVVAELALGDAKEQNIRELFVGPFPLENASICQIGGQSCKFQRLALAAILQEANVCAKPAVAHDRSSAAGFSRLLGGWPLRPEIATPQSRREGLCP